MANPNLGTAVLRTRLDNAGIKAGLDRTRGDVKRTTGQMLGDFERLAGGIVAAGAALYAARGLITGISTLAGEYENATNAAYSFNRQIQRSGEDSREAASMVDRLATRFGVLPQTVQDATTIMLRAGGTLVDVERTLTAAGASAVATGFDISQAFDNVSTAVATGRSELLETSGIITNLGPVTQNYARSVGKTVEELTQAEVIQARVNAIYKESEAEIEDVDQRLSGLAGTQSRTRGEWAEMRQEIGERFLPAVIAVTGALGGLLSAFNELPDAMQTTIITGGGVAAGLATTGVAAAGLLSVLRPLAPAFVTLRTAMMPFLGPAGILIGAVLGYQALNAAMNAGQQVRQQQAQDFRDLVRSMGAYRDQLVITSEEERTQLEAQLQRRRAALVATLEMQRAFAASIEADVIAFANKGFFGQLFGFGAANVDLDMLRTAEENLAVIEQQIAGIDTQLGQVRTMEITPNVVVPDPPANVDVDTDNLGIPKGGSVRTVTVNVVTREDREAARAQRRMTAPSYVVDAAVEYQNSRNSSEAFIRDARFAEIAAGNAAAGADFMRSGAFQVGEFLRTAIGEGVSFLESVAPIAKEYLREVEMAQARQNALADRSRQANQEFRAGERASFQTVDDFVLDRAVEESNRAGQEFLRNAQRQVGGWARGLGDLVAENTGLLEQVSLTAISASARIQANVILAQQALEESLIGTFNRTGARSGQVFSPGQATIGGRRGLLADDLAFGERAGELSLNLGRRANRGDGGLGLAEEIIKANEEAAETQQAAADRFSQAVISSAVAFTTNLVDAIRNGDIGAAFQAVLSAGQGVLGGADLGALSILGGSVPIAGLIAGGLGLLMSLIGGGFGGDSSEAARRREAERSRMASVPAININFTVEQTNNYSGGPTQPEVEQAFRRQAITLWEELYTRSLGPELSAIKNRLGMQS